MNPTDLPALLGGPPVRPRGPYILPPPDPAVLEALQAAHADGSWGRYHGGHVEQLEAELAAYHDVPFALTCASGTLAVEAALRAVGVGPGDEVILAAYDYPANFLSVHALGAFPVLVDLAAHNWNFDPDRLDAAVTSATRAVVVSHVHGGVVPMREVTEAAQRHNVAVIEDAAQAAGAVVQGRKAGSWGDVGVLSFGGSKLLSAGRGGAVLFRRPELRQRARLWLTRGNQQWAALSELQAVVLRPQLAKLDERTVVRASNADRLEALLRDVPGLSRFANRTPDTVPGLYKLGFRFDAEAFGLDRQRFVAAVRAEGVALDEGFASLHVGRAANRFRAAGELTEATRAHEGVVILHHPVLLGGEADVGEVAAAVRKVYVNAHRLRDSSPLTPSGGMG